ncbi:MAG: hypothetical protein KAH30_00950 [Caldisericia bacterium]|nr:hypothetical protein [Caldisericia bacterium]
MKKSITLVIILLCVLSLVSCDSTPLMVWKHKNRTQLVPIAWGYTLFSDQDIYGLMDGFGDVVWETEIDGARRAKWTCIDDTYFIEGDTHLILRVNIEDGELIWGWRAPSGTSVWIVGKYRDNLLLAYDQYSDYDKNPITILTLSVADSKTNWKIVDINYSGILNMPPPKFESDTLIIPTVSGDSIWIDGVSAVDGNHLWRVPWNFPPPGQPIVIAENKDYFWCWRMTGDTYQVSTVNKATGKVVGTAQTPTKKIIQIAHIGEKVFVRFDSEVGYFDNIVSYQKLDTDWMPVCEVFGIPEKLVAIGADCHSIGIMNTTDWTIGETFKTVSLCYSGVTGSMPGEFFLIPDYTPYDNASYRYLVQSEQLGKMLEGLKTR